MTVAERAGDVGPPLVDAPAAPAPAPAPAATSPDPAAGVAGDFVEMYSAHYRRVVRALELGGLDLAGAEDVAQEAFARTLGHWERVRTGTNPPGYVYRTAFRLARRALRREAPLPPEALSGPASGDDGPYVVTRATVEAVIAAMPYRRRSCVVLCLIAGLSSAEAARALGIAEGTVRKQIERGRADLRLALGEAPA